MIEALESRLLLAFVEEGTTLVLEGTNGDDRIIVIERASLLIVRTNDQTAQFPRSGINRIFYSEGPGDDYIKINSSINAMLDGWEGKDTLIGGAGNDTLNGESGDDQLFGRDGNDLVTGSLGHNFVSGGAGNDTVIGQNRGRDTLNGGAGNDTGTFDPGVDLGWQIETPMFIDFSTALEISWPDYGSGPLPEKLPAQLGHATELHHVRVIPLLYALLHPHRLHPLPRPVRPPPQLVLDASTVPIAARYDALFAAGAFNALFKFQNSTAKAINWDFSGSPDVSVEQFATYAQDP